MVPSAARVMIASSDCAMSSATPAEQSNASDMSRSFAGGGRDDLVHGLDERRYTEWLLEHRHARFEEPAADDLFVGVAADVEYLHVGPAIEQPGGQLAPTETGQHDVGDQYIDLARVQL